MLEYNVAKAPAVGKSMQTRVRRRCLGRVFCDLMHHYVEPGARARLHDLSSCRSRTRYQILDLFYLKS